MQSNIIKISNVHERDNEDLSHEEYTELYEDMEEELSEIPLLNRIKIVRSGQ